MSHIAETRRAMRERASESVLWRNAEEDTASTLHLQAAWLAARYDVGASHARILAEHAFARRPQR